MGLCLGLKGLKPSALLIEFASWMRFIPCSRSFPNLGDRTLLSSMTTEEISVHLLSSYDYLIDTLYQLRLRAEQERLGQLLFTSQLLKTQLQHGKEEHRKI